MSLRSELRGYTKPLAESVLAILIGAFVGALVLWFSGYSPGSAYYWLIKGSLGSADGIAEALSKAAPLILTAITFAIGARTGLFNIGAEGTVYFGAIAAIIVTQHLQNPIAGLLAGLLVGALWTLPAAVLKVFRGVHEVISTIMFNWIAFFVVSWLAVSVYYNPKDPNSTLPVPPSARLPLLMKGTSLSWSFIVAVLTAVIIFIVMWHTKLGYELRTSGQNPRAAEYGGINPRRSAIWSFVIGGMSAGLAGAGLVMGVPPSYAITQGLANVYGYGFDGIGVALVGRNHPLGIIFSGILFGALNAGATAMQQHAHVPLEMVKVIEGIIIIAVAVPGLLDLVTKVFRRGEA
ncbi:ribose ABC transporter permease [Thermococcus eurythermalis]|uniref:Ribose ABC transporter permease n=1 Tax=Thermococcus eurythermalis TaxID=1505907 RepID=A0A097QVD2_9EURY|nr:ABC transporter permease [Thermococcus eurythermalis]AIU70427.1 ribose ABC transporter permease [Thermococcus eurythermalis]